MDQEKNRTNGTRPTEIKTSLKCQNKHQEHNYTNPPKEESSNGEVSSVLSSSDIEDNQKIKYKARLSSQSKVEGNHRQAIQAPSTNSVERPPIEVKRVMRKDVFNRIRRSEEELQKAAEMVRGGMTFQTASDTFNIPISTIRFYMARRGILPQRRRGRGSSGVRDDDIIHPPFEIIHFRLPDIDKPV